MLIGHFDVTLLSAFWHTRYVLVACDSERVTAGSFTQCVLKIHRVGVLTALFSCYMAGATRNCRRLGACSVYTTQPCTSFVLLEPAHTYDACVFNSDLLPVLLAE